MHPMKYASHMIFLRFCMISKWCHYLYSVGNLKFKLKPTVRICKQNDISEHRRLSDRDGIRKSVLFEVSLRQVHLPHKIYPIKHLSRNSSTFLFARLLSVIQSDYSSQTKMLIQFKQKKDFDVVSTGESIDFECQPEHKLVELFAQLIDQEGFPHFLWFSFYDSDGDVLYDKNQTVQQYADQFDEGQAPVILYTPRVTLKFRTIPTDALSSWCLHHGPIFDFAPIPEIRHSAGFDCGMTLSAACNRFVNHGEFTHQTMQFYDCDRKWILQLWSQKFSAFMYSKFRKTQPFFPFGMTTILISSFEFSILQSNHCSRCMNVIWSWRSSSRTMGRSFFSSSCRLVMGIISTFTWRLRTSHTLVSRRSDGANRWRWTSCRAQIINTITVHCCKCMTVTSHKS